VSGRLGRGASSSAAGVMSARRRPSRSAPAHSAGDNVQEAMIRGEVILRCALAQRICLVHVRDRRYRLDWESQAAGWFSMIEALSLPLLPGVDAVITQYCDVIDRD
jgi:hypothetical protein